MRVIIDSEDRSAVSSPVPSSTEPREQSSSAPTVINAGPPSASLLESIASSASGDYPQENGRSGGANGGPPSEALLAAIRGSGGMATPDDTGLISGGASSLAG